MEAIAVASAVAGIVGSISSATSAITSSRQQANLMEAEAAQKKFQAEQETINAKEQANTIQRQLVEDIASQNATFAARGVLISSGSAYAAASRSAQNASRDVQAARRTGINNSFALNAESALAKSGARATKTAGTLNAISYGAKGLQQAASLIPS